MTYVDLWGWMYDQHRRFVAEDDTTRQRLRRFYLEGEDHRFNEPERALAAFRDGAALAESLGEPCWMLFFRFWITSIYLYHMDDLPTAMRLAAEDIVEARKPQYAGCPILGRVYYTAMHVLFFADPVGHAERINELIDYMTENIALDYDTACRMAAARARLAFEFGNLDQAEELALEYLALSDHSQFRQAYAHGLLMLVAFWREQPDMALIYAQQAEKSAWNGGNYGALPSSLAMQALLNRRLEDEDAARENYRRALAQQARLGNTPDSTYYNGLCYFLEDGGEAEQALALRDQQIIESQRSGRTSHAAEVQLRRARLLGRMGLLTPDDLASLHTAAEGLLAPAHFLANVARVERGDYKERL